MRGLQQGLPSTPASPTSTTALVPPNTPRTHPLSTPMFSLTSPTPSIQELHHSVKSLNAQNVALHTSLNSFQSNITSQFAALQQSMRETILQIQLWHNHNKSITHPSPPTLSLLRLHHPIQPHIHSPSALFNPFVPLGPVLVFQTPHLQSITAHPFPLLNPPPPPFPAQPPLVSPLLFHNLHIPRSPPFHLCSAIIQIHSTQISHFFFKFPTFFSLQSLLSI